MRRVEPGGEAEVKFLLDEIRKKDQELGELRKKVTEAANDRHQLEDLKKQLDEKTQEIQELTDQLIKEKAKQVPNAKPIVAEITSKQLTEAIQVVRSSIDFCLTDIDSRAGMMKTEGAPTNRKIDAIVRLSTTPSGTAFDVLTTGLSYSPAARLCIEDALKRVAYPKGSETLDIRVTVSWTAGSLNMTAAVVGQRAAGGSTLLDL